MSFERSTPKMWSMHVISTLHPAGSGKLESFQLLPKVCAFTIASYEEGAKYEILKCPREGWAVCVYDMCTHKRKLQQQQCFWCNDCYYHYYYRKWNLWLLSNERRQPA